jgi:hypothetical protein
MRSLATALILGLLAASLGPVGRAAADAAALPAGSAAAPALPEASSCGACTLRHQTRIRAKAREAAGDAPDGCRIKGEITAAGERLYHAPGAPSYAGTEISPAAGERWFCSVGQAEAAGWRAADD